MKNLILFLICTTFLSAKAQHQPAPKQVESILITNAVIHNGLGQTMQDGSIGFKDGIIIYIGSSSTAQKSGYSKIIDAKQSHVYPGFIAANSTLGLLEIDAVKATDDMAEIGSYNPNVRSIIAFNTESKVIETARQNGILLAQITPRNGRICGKSSIVQLDGWNWKDALILEDEGLHVDFPETFARDWSDGSGKLAPSKNYDKQVTALENYLKDGLNYAQQEREQRNEPLLAIANWKKSNGTLYIRAAEERQITDAVLMTKRLKLEKVVIVGGNQADKLTTFLKQNNVSVLLSRVHSLPDNDTDPVEKPFAMPAMLLKGGVLVALQNESSMERMNTRNLPFMAGTAAGFGLSKEEALQLITSNAAKILGIDAKYGSLEVGKSATLFISAGDALDMRTNDVTHAFIDGRSIDLTTHQTELYDKFRKKYGQ